MIKPRFLVTGGTGFLGKKLLPELKKWADFDLISRSDKSEIHGDFTLENCGIDLISFKKKIAKENRSYQGFIHLGALYDLKASRKDLWLQNIEGTKNVLKLCEELEIPFFVNASSIAAAINSPHKMVSSDELNFEENFPDFYSESKARAEVLIKNWEGPILNRLNLRLGILVGDSISGEIQRIDGVYYTPQTLKKMKPLFDILLKGISVYYRFSFPIFLPGSEQSLLPLVPVDQAAKGFSELTRLMYLKSLAETFAYESFYLVPKKGLSIRQLYQSTMNHLFSKSISDRISILLIQTIPDKLISILCSIFSFPVEQVRYSLKIPKFESSKTFEILSEDWCSEFSDYENIFWKGYDDYSNLKKDLNLNKNENENINKSEKNGAIL